MTKSEVKLHWQAYHLFPYERDLALREIRSLLRPSTVDAGPHLITLRTRAKSSAIRRLTYFARADTPDGTIETAQAEIERTALGQPGASCHRQATRYSVHGLHEYKGKFNPQVAKALINILGIRPGSTILDPFCGSGTTLVECVHAGIRAVGCDLNPLAVFVAKAKLLALGIPGQTIRILAQRIVVHSRQRRHPTDDGAGARGAYLQHWFPAGNLERLESLRLSIAKQAPIIEPLFLTVASDLLRDYSLQEPQDLRIRRRKNSPPDNDLLDAFLDRCCKLAASVDAVRSELPRRLSEHRVFLASSESLSKHPDFMVGPAFHGAITSPPYATALPYIDTQRLSLIWLGLCAPSDIPGLQAELIGSREFRGGQRTDWQSRMKRNTDALPESIHRLCLTITRSLAPTDGFRRQAVPSLLYRYCVGMRNAIRSVGTLLRAKAPFALVVGHNHTVIGGRRFDINTPELLQSIASQAGMPVDERIALQAYQRYGLHQNNAIAKEDLLILRKP